MLQLFTDRLDPARQIIFDKLKEFADDYVLAGGTAMMLQIGHRESYDFDCFSPNYLPITLKPKTKRVFGKYITFQLETSEMMMITVENGVQISFVWHPYPPLKPAIHTRSMPLFHMDDLVTNKAMTIGRRSAWRDYVDLFIVIKWHLYTLDQIVLLSKKRLKKEFNEKLFLEQLTYFTDIDISDTKFLKENYSVEQIQEGLRTEVKKYLARNL